MTLCFDSVKHKLTHKLGFFDLLGFDFMVDTDFNVSIALFLLACHTTGIREPRSKVTAASFPGSPGLSHTVCWYVPGVQRSILTHMHMYTCRCG